jgi:hypothetical protein
MPPPTTWTPEEEAVFAGLTTVAAIQTYIDTQIPYRALPDGGYSPRRTLRDGHAHCFGGALFAAAALKRLGIRPALVQIDDDLKDDDDHILCVYQIDGRWGCVAKSNWVMLRARAPVYASVRELAMSYFDVYVTDKGRMTMSGFSDPVWLEPFEDRGEGKEGWETTMENMEDLDNMIIHGVPHTKIVTTAAQRDALGVKGEVFIRASMADTDKSNIKGGY